MKTSTGRPSRPAWLERVRKTPGAVWERLAFAALCVGGFVGYLSYPTYPIYDSEYYLIWGGELLHGHLPSFGVYRAPTEHPLAVAFGTVLSTLGGYALRVEVLCAVASFLLVTAGLYRLARTAFSPIVGAVAVALFLTRFNVAFLAARGYVDVAYLAAIVWAAALEIERPRRGTAVFVLLLAAELIRPDAWLLAGLYWLWVAPRADWPTRIRWALLVAAGPVLWVLLDGIVTGAPLHSLTTTHDLAVALGRTVPIAQVPGTTWHYLKLLIKAPVFYGALAGLILSAWLMPKRMFAPSAVIASGIGTFILIAGAGLSVIDRYLLVPASMLLVFCAFALSGWTMLDRGLLRRVWAVGAMALAAVGIYEAATTVSVSHIQQELGFRDSAHTSLVAIVQNPKVRAALRCGPVSVPNHKLIPDLRFLLDRGPSGVIARSNARNLNAAGHPHLEHELRYGVALYPLGLAVSRYALVTTADDPLDQVPLAGYTRVANTPYFAAYARCPSP